MLKPSRRKKRARGSLARAAERRSVPCTTRAGSASPSQGFAADSVTVIALLAGATVGLMSLIFAPISVWPLAFVCLVPWLLVVSTSNNPRRVYVASFGVGLAFHLINMWWLSHVTVPGYVVWSAGIALYFPLMACPLRHWVRRRRMPLAIGLPIIWIACECVRAWMLTGFPWFFLAHSQYRFLTLIQISDLFGAYAVSFVVAAVNGAIVDVLLPRLGGTGEAAPGVTRRPAFSRWVGPAFAATLLLATLVYGTIQLRRDTTSSGPRVAVIQGDYPLFVDVDRNRKRADEKMARYMELMREAQAAGEEPDLFLLPETPWRMLLNREFLELEPAELAPAKRLSLQWSRRCADFFQAWAEEMNATVVTGAFSTVLTPLNLRAEERNYNSAFVFAPDGSPTERYDKNHLVVFGEFVPFRYGKLRFLYHWLHQFMPIAWLEGGGTYEYSLTAGEEFSVFSMPAPSLNGREFHFGTPICYEDVMPYVSRRFVTGPDGAKRVDFLLNISNDGWFVHSNELPQHLAICAFRAVENRVGIARAVNTGISGFIDPDGFIHDLVTRDGRYHGPGIDGFAVARLKVDSRHTVYSRIGDVLARVCTVLWLLAYADYLIVRARSARREALNREQHA